MKTNIMSGLLSFKGDYFGQAGKASASLLLIHFVNEHGTHIIYSPHLDLSGYGKTMDEAKEAFEDAFTDFISYTLNKKTLGKVLERLGWKIKGSSKHPKRMKTPPMSEVIDKDYVSEIFEKYDVQTFRQPVNIPQMI